MRTYTRANTVDLKSCLKDLKWLVRNYHDISMYGVNARIETETAKGFFDIDLGLCWNILNEHNIEGDEFLWYGWGMYSGDACYPVGGEEEYEGASHLYDNLDRLELAKHCITKIKAELRSRGAIC